MPPTLRDRHVLADSGGYGGRERWRHRGCPPTLPIGLTLRISRGLLEVLEVFAHLPHVRAHARSPAHTCVCTRKNFRKPPTPPTSGVLASIIRMILRFSRVGDSASEPPTRLQRLQHVRKNWRADTCSDLTPAHRIEGMRSIPRGWVSCRWHAGVRHGVASVGATSRRNGTPSVDEEPGHFSPVGRVRRGPRGRSARRRRRKSVPRNPSTSVLIGVPP